MKLFTFFNKQAISLNKQTTSPKAKRGLRPHWYYLYYLLAAFDLFTVGTSLYLNRNIMAIYSRSVEVNQNWAVRLSEYSHLGQLAAAVNAPGNDVFDSHNVAFESERLRAALRNFQTEVTAAKQELQANVSNIHAKVLLQDLETVEAAMSDMASEANLIFAYFQQNHPEMAGRRMATMDRKYNQVNTALTTLRQTVSNVQQQLFEQQKAETYALRKFEYAIALFMITMVGGVTLYGHKLAKQIESDAKAKEKSIQDLQAAEAHLTQQTHELEQALQQVQQTPQLVQNEKMISLGQLVAGVAHEINNPVNFIYGNLSHTSESTQDLLDLLMLYQKCYPNAASEIQQKAEEIDLEFLVEDLPKMLTSMQLGTDRIRQIVLSLRNFSRLDEAEMKSVDIHEGLDNTLLLLQHRLKGCGKHAKIEIIKDYGKLPMVECYAGQLNQVFMNLLVNAIDALEESWRSADRALESGEFQNAVQKFPTIRIQTQVVDRDRVSIEITDNGSGIPENVRQRLFEPFFTTKPVGKGTGLGLSISHQIVTDKHGGQIRCTSAPGIGSNFHIEIPIQQHQPLVVMV